MKKIREQIKKYIRKLQSRGRVKLQSFVYRDNILHLNFKIYTGKFEEDKEIIEEEKYKIKLEMDKGEYDYRIKPLLKQLRRVIFNKV